MVMEACKAKKEASTRSPMPEHSRNVQGTLMVTPEHSGNVQCPFQGTLMAAPEHSGNVQCPFQGTLMVGPEQWSQLPSCPAAAPGFSQLPSSAVTSAVDHPLGAPALFYLPRGTVFLA
jgi:hypothetical protein